MKKAIIVGGGFAGIRCALDLAKRNKGNLKIVLISDKTHFEYYPSLYRVVVGESPLEVCVPLFEIFKGYDVEIVKDRISTVDIKTKKLKSESGSEYHYDYLVLALGSEASYFNVPGLEERSLSFKSINEAIKLKNHLHKLFEMHLTLPKEDLVSNLHIIVVGGGASGVELAGVLQEYLGGLAEKHKIEKSFITIDLIEAAPRVLPALPPAVSERVLAQLRKQGVNVFLNRALMKEEIEEIYMNDMTLKSNTVIWTAGTKVNHLYKDIAGLAFQKNGKVIVDEYMQVEDVADVFVAGDAAFTPYAGLAQTAIYDGGYIARAISMKARGKMPTKYAPKKISYVIPVGEGWAAAVVGPLRIYGRLAWWLRNIIDLKYFLSILPFSKARRASSKGETICQACEICSVEAK